MKAIVFDLDGVLFDSPDVHFDALNMSLLQHGLNKISEKDHINIYNGLSTNQKLSKLGVSDNLRKAIQQTKQKITISLLKATIREDVRLYRFLNSLKNVGIKLACATNCVRESQLLILRLLGIIELFDVLLCNEDVENPKPSPDIYNKCILKLGFDGNDVVIVEDSPTGIAAAKASEAGNVITVKGPHDIHLKTLFPDIKNPKLVIPMAGKGSRFANVGYKDPKPFIDVLGKTMIETVTNNLSTDLQNAIYICQKEWVDRTTKLFPQSQIVGIEGYTEGAACTVQKGLETLHDNDSVIVANSDQYVVWDKDEFLIKMHLLQADGGIVTFKASDNKWSYVKLSADDNNVATHVAEKKVISNVATVGIYWWKKVSMLKESITKMVACNDRYNNEFYLCPTFNYMIKKSLRVCVYESKKMWSLGTPICLDKYLTHHWPTFISHKGNVTGIDAKTENNPEHINAVLRKYDVEVDFWVLSNSRLYLGHDEPIHEIDPKFLQNKRLWIHCKNTQALQYVVDNKLRGFYHNVDDYTMTTTGQIWVYPGKECPKGGVIVKPNKMYTMDEINKAAHVCSDTIYPMCWIKKTCLILIRGETFREGRYKMSETADFKEQVDTLESILNYIVLGVKAQGYYPSLILELICPQKHIGKLKDTVHNMFGHYIQHLGIHNKRLGRAQRDTTRIVLEKHETKLSDSDIFIITRPDLYWSKSPLPKLSTTTKITALGMLAKNGVHGVMDQIFVCPKELTTKFVNYMKNPSHKGKETNYHDIIKIFPDIVTCLTNEKYYSNTETGWNPYYRIIGRSTTKNRYPANHKF